MRRRARGMVSAKVEPTTMSKRYFTAAQANQLLPALEQIFGRVLRLRGQIHAVAEHLEDMGETFSPEELAPLLEGDGVLFELTSARVRARALVETLREELAA